MPNPFAAADAKSSAAVSFVFGERLRLLPMTPGEFARKGGPDPDRDPKDFTGTLSGELGSMSFSGMERGGNFASGITTRDRAVTADYSQWPAYGRKGDRIKAIDQPGQPEFEISDDPKDDGSGNRIIAGLVTT